MQPRMQTDAQTLKSELLSIDGRGYPSYKKIRGQYRFDAFELLIDYVQGDPFAGPSRVRARVPLDKAGFPDHCFDLKSRRVAFRDYLARSFSASCEKARERQGSGKSGLISMERPAQEILERSSVMIDGAYLEARFMIGLPARGRKVLGKQAAILLCEKLPQIVRDCLYYEGGQEHELRRHLDTAEDATALRQALYDRGLIAFVVDGAVLPRRSGIDDRPLSGGEIPFKSPDSMRVTLPTPCSGEVTGMGIRKGVTLIAGGGYHGKSTLLNALERGVYNHVPGDGREKVVSIDSAVKIRAEDGRSVQGVDIRPFIDNLPGYGRPDSFCTQNASGSTSQAANMMEAIEMGSEALFLDEDTCATNLMIRDARMQALVEKAGEPITPYLDRVRGLYETRGISAILVLGGSGDYFEVADCVIRMDHFEPFDVTDRAKQIASQYPSMRKPENETSWPGDSGKRVPDSGSIDPRKGKKAVSIKTRATRAVVFGRHEIDVEQVSQLVDEGQLKAIGQAIEVFRRKLGKENAALKEVIHSICDEIDRNGLDVLDERKSGEYARFRPCELAAAVNRLRTLRIHEG